MDLYSCDLDGFDLFGAPGIADFWTLKPEPEGVYPRRKRKQWIVSELAETCRTNPMQIDSFLFSPLWGIHNLHW
jgi:hypothetical protein